MLLLFPLLFPLLLRPKNQLLFRFGLLMGSLLVAVIECADDDEEEDDDGGDDGDDGDALILLLKYIALELPTLLTVELE